MVCKTKTLNLAAGDYIAPSCKVYSIALESVIAGSENSANNGYDNGNNLEDI